ncbi:MAG: phosphatidate cytidylyltransferase [Acidobacteriota bacterium]
MTLDLPRAVLISLGGIFALLVVASLIVVVLGRLKPNLALNEVRLRIKSWWIMAVVFALALVANRTVTLVFFAFVSFLALKEFLSLVPTRRADRRVLFWAYLSIPFQFFWIARAWYGMFIIFVPVYMFLLIPTRMVLIGETRGFLRAAGILHWGMMTTVFSLSHIAYLLVLPARGNPAGGGPGLLLFLVFLTQFNDVAQFLWGRLFGRRPALPSVSPGKTLEGLLGGVATTVLVAYLAAPYLTPLVPRDALAAGLIIGLGGFLGDVVISALKRDLRLKDSGSLIPGHGGILDRIDSLTYTAPLFFHFVYYLYY